MKQSDMIKIALRNYSNVQEESLRVFVPGDNVLKEIVDKFLLTRSKREPSHIVCFFETRSSNVGSIVRGQPKQVRPFLKSGFLFTDTCIGILGQ